MLCASPAAASVVATSAIDAGASGSLRGLLEPARRRPPATTESDGLVPAPSTGGREQVNQPSTRAVGSESAAFDDGKGGVDDSDDDAAMVRQGAADQPLAVPLRIGWTKAVDYALMGEAIMSGG